MSYTYDPRGNRATYSGSFAPTTYAGDAQNRMVGVTLPDATTVSYGYDADGRRVTSTLGANTRQFVWNERST